MSESTETIVIELAGLGATDELAAKLARVARPGDVVALSGDLGCGKTAFARAFVRALTDPDEDVPSPTFTLVQTYESTAGDIWHFDLYRLETPEDAFELGIEDAFHDAITLIEWPDRLGPYLPRVRLDIHLAVSKGKNHRCCTLTPHSAWSQRLRTCGHG
ncbi:MAG: tRNA (adenosine(37)-N6)-threonylcarbamoyltransferase complex ATPase subunit type 1 TsaE [Alphaproteobacteria bacterium]|nr:tRNA (adenosine(37)-N6)-threonylcarbamoyltransferase complex ATPase subunit type 1 TsaE [Alphaproteobacteria bacterium]